MATDRLAPIIADTVDKLRSVAAASGYFDTTLTYEPKSNPGPGMIFATWINQILPVALVSGLDATAARLVMTCRIYLPVLTDPQDTIDTRIMQASSYLLTELTGAFTVDGAWIDLLGAHGDGLGTDSGYVPIDESVFRIADTLVPIICPDVFDQEA